MQNKAMVPVAPRSRWLAYAVLPHEPALRRWLGSMPVSGEFDIDDIIQESYAVLVRRDAVDDIVDPRAYLFQVAKSLILQKLRRSRIVSITSVADIGDLDAAADRPSPEQEVIGRDELARVARAIAAMPKQTRRAFLLRRVDGLSQREIAAQLGVSENTVEKQIGAGIKYLMAQFGRGGKASVRASLTNIDGVPRLDAQTRTRSED